MTTRKVRGYGSFDDIPRKDALSFPLQPHIDGETMGFRLANDGETEICRGAPWFEVPAEPIQCEDVPSTRSYCTGFRLVFDNDKEDEWQTM
jgi:hypothetical protein